LKVSTNSTTDFALASACSRVAPVLAPLKKCFSFHSGRLRRAEKPIILSPKRLSSGLVLRLLSMPAKRAATCA